MEEEKIKEVAEACAALEDKRGGIAWDEIEIRAGIVYSKSTQEVIGLADRSIPVKNISDVNSQFIQDNIATHVFQVREEPRTTTNKKNEGETETELTTLFSIIAII